MLRDAHSLLRGIPKPNPKSDPGPTRGDGGQDSLLRAEADYPQLLLGEKSTHDGSNTGKSWWCLFVFLNLFLSDHVRLFRRCVHVA